MTNEMDNDSQIPKSAGSSNSSDRRSPDQPMPDEATQEALDRGDSEKIDRVLDELNVSTTESGKDQTGKSDTEGSNSSSKNLDEQKE